jgi:hypothetical protein
MAADLRPFGRGGLFAPYLVTGLRSPTQVDRDGCSPPSAISGRVSAYRRREQRRAQARGSNGNGGTWARVAGPQHLTMYISVSETEIFNELVRDFVLRHVHPVSAAWQTAAIVPDDVLRVDVFGAGGGSFAARRLGTARLRQTACARRPGLENRPDGHEVDDMAGGLSR